MAGQTGTMSLKHLLLGAADSLLVRQTRLDFALPGL